MNAQQRAVLAHIVVDPDGWYAHAVTTLGQEAGDAALVGKVAAWEPEYLAQKDLPGYQTRSQRDAAANIPVDPTLVVIDKINALWTAADAYEKNYISGVAIGLLTLGVIQSKPKALAVSAWSASHWDDYYTRKAAITATSVLNLDFSPSGAIPYSVPELRAELGM